MPKLGDVKLDIVYSEDRDRQTKTTDKPIEGGLSIADHIEKDPIKLKITGVCTSSSASASMTKLKAYQDAGKRLTYVGRYTFKDAVIESMSTTKDVDIAGGGYKFDITLKQIIIVAAQKYSKSKPKPKTSAGKKQPTSKGPNKRVYYTVQSGDVLSKIAQKFYGHSTEKYWRKIYDANKKVIGSNPHSIKKGMKLIIP
jgi:nucleoid-associated protein YgaU